MIEKPQETFERLISTLPSYERGLLNQEGRTTQALSAFPGRTLYLSTVTEDAHSLALQVQVTDFCATVSGAHAELTAPDGSHWYVTHRPSDVFGSGLLMWLPAHGRLQYAHTRGQLSVGFSVIASVSDRQVIEDHSAYMRRMG